MDWVLGLTTLLVNSALGWTRGKSWMWGLHALNAAIWVAYCITIEQYGLILLSSGTIVVDLVSAYRAHRKEQSARFQKLGLDKS